MSDLRRRLFHELEPVHRDAGLSMLNRFIVVVILVSVAFVVVESEPAIIIAVTADRISGTS